MSDKGLQQLILFAIFAVVAIVDHLMKARARRQQPPPPLPPRRDDGVGEEAQPWEGLPPWMRDGPMAPIPFPPQRPEPEVTPLPPRRADAPARVDRPVRPPRPARAPLASAEEVQWKRRRGGSTAGTTATIAPAVARSGQAGARTASRIGVRPGIRALVGDPDAARRAVIAATVLGPCRAMQPLGPDADPR